MLSLVSERRDILSASAVLDREPEPVPIEEKQKKK